MHSPQGWGSFVRLSGEGEGEGEGGFLSEFMPVHAPRINGGRGCHEYVPEFSPGMTPVQPLLPGGKTAIDFRASQGSPPEIMCSFHMGFY